MTLKTMEKELQSTQYGLKAALFSLFSLGEKIENKPWAKLTIFAIGPLYALGFILSSGYQIAKAHATKNKNYAWAGKLLFSLAYAAIAVIVCLSMLSVVTFNFALTAIYCGAALSFINNGMAMLHATYQAYITPSLAAEKSTASHRLLKAGLDLTISLSTYLAITLLAGPGRDIGSWLYFASCATTATLSLGVVLLQHYNPFSTTTPPTLQTTTNSAELDTLTPSESTKRHTPKEHSPNQQPFFARQYRKVMVQQLLESDSSLEAVAYLKYQIHDKCRLYPQANLSDKDQAKFDALMKAQSWLTEPASQENLEQLHHLLNTNNQIHQSFFCLTSDTVDILEAVELYLQSAIAAQPCQSITLGS